ncbi:MULTISPECIES: teichoic acids export ABC transporter ATP-binding subunit TagH [Bacillus]|uniref:teichoic acids export ABC transporter ATP-binding subunit TagH n=1 Tax=Bacillus TaxID=1386 RepID=UPI000BF5403B|nr:teichoic acids export ABC transporter ATP-binding subunit TagH [Bacillus wiedmannii]PEP49262.1 teichoic acid ABC transporter ATP-binding protein [Bacillus wiedmannii]PHA38046.1 teichoic acid ABC transporter ATP-binding protein [Bacillus wiedmannii]PTC13561.1 teichoic acids export ABC transporter ATP-binding subunit TagH [Bacillus wiedmannii]
MNESVRFHNVTKKYKMHSKNSDKLKDIMYPGGFGEDFYALRNLEFVAQKGDVIGIVGVNGSGKSTMSNLIAGITPPTKGKIDIKGKVALIAIAAGLNNQLSGRENIELKCLMMGLSKEKIEKLTPEIIEFADIGKFIDMPVKKYSSGMKSRLGFAISVSINPDVLVIDEALSVGDQTFADKCLTRMNEFKEQGKTIFFVSHSSGQVKKFCTKALWLEYGEIKDYGPIQEIVPKYENFLKEYKAMSKEEQQKFKKESMEKQAGKILIKNEAAKSENEAQAVDYVSLLRKQSSHHIKKKKGRKFLSVFILLMMLGGITYWQKDNILHSLQAKEQKKESIDKVEVPKKEENPLATLDVRYVNSAKGRVRSKPNLDGQVVGTILFGTPFIVKEQQKEIESDINWLKLTLENGEEGWISESIVKSIPYNQAISYNKFLGELKEIEGITPNLEEYLAFLGKTKEEIINTLGNSQNEKQLAAGTLVQYKDIDIVYNNQSIVQKINIKNMKIPKESLFEKLGEAQLKAEDDSLFIYRSNKFDFNFSLIGSTINSISIFDVSKY